MLVANATASLAFPQTPEGWTLLDPSPVKPTIVNCKKPTTVDITMTGEQGWTLDVVATKGCRPQQTDFSTRKLTGEKKGTPSVVAYKLPVEETFENVTAMVLIPTLPDTLVVAWH